MGSSSTASVADLSPPGTAPHRGGALDVLRLTVALLVVLYAFGPMAPVPLFKLSPLFGRAYLATDFFLLLSGFVLARRHGAAVSAGRVRPTAFLLRRIARIWPAHLIVLGAMIALAFLSGQALSASEILPQAMLVQAWGSFGGFGWNSLTWTLSVLVLCYAAFPLIWNVMARLSQSVGVVLALALLFAVDAFVRLKIGESLFTAPPQFGVLRGLPLFILGAAIARATDGPVMPRWLAVYALVCSLAGFMLAQAVDSASVSVMAMALSLATIGSMAQGAHNRAAAYAGRLSFPLFISHGLAAMIWAGFMDSFGGFEGGLAWAAFGASVAFAILFAMVFERFVDRPVQKALRRALDARRKPSVVLPAAA